jgi:hypothetical protein
MKIINKVSNKLKRSLILTANSIHLIVTNKPINNKKKLIGKKFINKENKKY